MKLVTHKDGPVSLQFDSFEDATNLLAILTLMDALLAKPPLATSEVGTLHTLPPGVFVAALNLLSIGINTTKADEQIAKLTSTLKTINKLAVTVADHLQTCEDYNMEL